MGKAAPEFFEHLDACHQCESQPFNLCATGARLLRQTTEELTDLQSRADHQRGDRDQ